MVGELSNVVVNYFDLMGKEAIEFFLAAHFGLLPKCDVESAKVLQYLLGIDDMSSNFRPVYMEQGPEKKIELMKIMVNDHIKPFLVRYNKFLKDNGSAIEFFLAAHFGLLPKCDVGNAKVLQYLLGIDNMSSNFRPVYMEQDPEKKIELMKIMVNDHIKPFLVRYNKFLKDNGSG
uniref:CHK domain-containing protein n=1 Tax=Rhabditophanes sp. KR3021 TaxID=114890 RepID=A0AC35TQI8_9BILA